MITRVKFIAIAAVLVASLSGATVAEARQGMGGGMGARPETQCKNKNDLAFMPGVSCNMTPG